MRGMKINTKRIFEIDEEMKKFFGFWCDVFLSVLECS
jgi:hypothetical protein